MNVNDILITKNRVFVLLFTVFLVLLLPLIAMQFTNEVHWDVYDFVIAGVVLYSFGYLYEVLAKISNNKILIGLMVFGLFIFVWVSLI